MNITGGVGHRVIPLKVKVKNGSMSNCVDEC